MLIIQNENIIQKSANKNMLNFVPYPSKNEQGVGGALEATTLILLIYWKTAVLLQKEVQRLNLRQK